MSDVEPVSVIRGRMLPLDRADVDTDQIIPKQFLKWTQRTGYGDVIFYDWRKNPDFVLNDPRYTAATILITGPNFGSGSSREHAPWGLEEYGFRAIVAPSFGDIFRNNCTNIGLLTATVPNSKIEYLLRLALEMPDTEIELDLLNQRLGGPDIESEFGIDPVHRVQLLSGKSLVDFALATEPTITSYETQREGWLPTTK